MSILWLEGPKTRHRAECARAEPVRVHAADPSSLDQDRRPMRTVCGLPISGLAYALNLPEGVSCPDCKLKIMPGLPNAA